MNKITVTRWNERKGYNVTIVIDLKGYETEATVSSIINDFVDDPHVVCVEYNKQTYYGRFKNPIETL